MCSDSSVPTWTPTEQVFEIGKLKPLRRMDVHGVLFSLSIPPDVQI